MEKTPKSQGGKDYLICPICKNYFKEPTTIGCQHTFCIKCIKSHANQHHTVHSVNCPVCKETCAIHYKKNCVIEALLESVIPEITSKRRQKAERKAQLLVFQKEYYYSHRRYRILQTLYLFEQGFKERQTSCTSPVTHVSQLFQEISKRVPDLLVHEEEFFACLYQVLKFGWPMFITSVDSTPEEAPLTGGDYEEDIGLLFSDSMEEEKSVSNSDQQPLWVTQIAQMSLDIAQVSIGNNRIDSYIPKVAIRPNARCGTYIQKKDTRTTNRSASSLPFIILIDGLIGCVMTDSERNKRFVSEWKPNERNYRDDLFNIIWLSLLSGNEEMKSIYCQMLNHLLGTTNEQLQLYEKYRGENAHITFNVMDHIRENNLSLVSGEKRMKQLTEPIYGKQFPLQ